MSRPYYRRAPRHQRRDTDTLLSLVIGALVAFVLGMTYMAIYRSYLP
jgi:hypothetical protein